jgi:hypothetical protein
MNATKVNTSLALTLLMLLVACATPPKVRVDKDSSTNFASYKTFAWLGVRNSPPAATAAPGHPITPEGNSIAENRVRNAVIEVLQAKGYVLTNGNPDFRVSYALNVYEKHKDSGMRIGLGAGGGGGNMSGGVGVSVPVGKATDTMGTMTIDIIDATRNAQVWTGAYEQKIGKDALTDEDAKKIVSTILARFPTDSAKK